MHICKRVTAIVGALLGIGVVGAPNASATVYDEIYPCTQTDSWPDGWIGNCDGTWYNANPHSRSIRLVFTGVTHAEESGYNNTPVSYVESLDGSEKTITYYCEFADGTTSGSKGKTTIGGRHPKAHSYSPNWNPCVGNWIGVYAVVRGWYNGSSQIISDIEVNTHYYIHAHRGYECTYPNHCT